MGLREEQLINELAAVKESAKKIREGSDILADMLTKGIKNPTFLNREIGKVNQSCKTVINTMGAVFDYGSMFNQQTFGTPGLTEDIKIEWIGERLHIVFPALLPYRFGSNKEALALTRGQIEAMYLPAINDFFSKIENKRKYDKKVILMFTHFYLKGEHKKDLDNIETRYITNIIASHVLVDDAPDWCGLYFDTKIGKKRHTELDVVPYADFMKILSVR